MITKIGYEASGQMQEVDGVVAGKLSQAHAPKPRSVSRVPLADRIHNTLKLEVGTYQTPLPRRQIKLPPNPTETEPAPKSADERMPSSSPVSRASRSPSGGVRKSACDKALPRSRIPH